jgi:VWFA-related protein
MISLLLILTALAGAGRAALAQGGVSVKFDSLDPSQLPTMTARLSVVDENGLPILGLTTDNFEFSEDGRTLVKPSGVSTAANDKAATSVLLLFDLAGTMKGEPLKAAKEASANFLDDLLNETSDPDRAAFIGFGSKVDIKAIALEEGPREAPFTNDKGRLLNVINFVESDASGGTPLYDALYRGIKIMAGQPGRRAIIIMTDGADVGSVLKQDDPIDEARRQHIPVFPVGLSNSRLDAAYLKRVAELTGGQYQEAPSPADLTEKFAAVLSELKIQYTITYPSQWSKLDTQTHSVLVRVQTARGQAYDEMRVQLVKPTATPSATLVPGAPTHTPSAAPSAQHTPTPQPTASPTPQAAKEAGMLDNLRTWVTDNTLLAAGIGVAAFLFLMLIVLAIILMRRRAGAASPTASENLAPPAWGGAEAPPVQPAAYAPEPRGGPAGGTTVSADGAPPGPTGTWVAPMEQPVARQPFGVPPAAPRRREEPEVDSTVALPRGARAKVVGLLVDRRQPSRRHDLSQPSNAIGRSSSNAVVIDDPTISRAHAMIKLEGGEFRLYDLGSANGTFVGEQRVREPVTLEDGAIVRFGDAEFIFKRVSLE